MENKILHAKIKGSVEKNVIKVYKLSDGRYNRFLGEEMSIPKIVKRVHMETYMPDQLEFVKSPNE